MNFYTLVKGLDELLFEIMSWLVFYPITLSDVRSRPRADISSVGSLAFQLKRRRL